MSAIQLFLARAEVLALAPVSAAEQLDRAAADQAIRSTLHRHGGLRSCAAALAQEFGEHPELAAERMTWARRTIAALYPSSTRACPA
jgi:hypothetical protein